MFGKRCTIPAGLLIIIAFSGCNNLRQGDEATITLNLGGRNSRAVVDDATLERLNYTIVLTGPTDTIILYHAGGGTITATVAPGNWNIAITANMGLQPTEIWLFPNGNKPFAEGLQNANIQAGQNTVTVNMTVLNRPLSYNTLEEAMFAIRDDYGDGEFTVSIGTLTGVHYMGDDTGGDLNPGSFNITHITLTSHGNGSAAVEVDGGSIFSVPSNTTLTLEGNITFTGQDSYFWSLIEVSGGVLNIKDNVVIRGNTNTTSGSGGITVGTGGTLNMTGGYITGNTAGIGSGVYVYNGGTFNMMGGTISGNTTIVPLDPGEGVDVLVESGGNFIWTGGTIDDCNELN